jgi:predicted anti-sigma-YlaC factor YlaD
MSHRCERARAAISLQLDDGLSCVEHAFLERHLARCPSCSEFRAECRAFTGALRGADLERTSTTLLLAVRPRTQRRRAVQRAAVAFAGVATLAFAGLYGAARVEQLSSHDVSTSGRPAYYESADFELGLLRPARVSRGTVDSVPL